MTQSLEEVGPLERGRLIKVSATVGWLVVFVTALLMLIRASTIAYSPDSWAYVDIARSLLEPNRGLGEILGTRDFVNEPWRNDSFPFLWPVILSPGIAVWGASSPIGAVIFVAIWLFTSLILMLTARHLRLPSFLAPVLALSLLAISGYVNEGNAGRSIPLTVLLVAASLLLVLRHQGNPWTALLIGVLLGLCAANRFDSLLYGPTVIILALFFGYLTWKGAIAAMCGWVVAPLTWVAYSVAQLGGIYATDNSRVVLSPVPTFVRDWPASVTQEGPNLFALAIKMLGNLDVMAKSLVRAYWLWVIAGIIALIFGIALAWVRQGSVANTVVRWFPREVTVDIRRWSYFLASLSLALMAIQAGLILTTGYGEARYWGTSGLLLLELGAALPVALRSTAAAWQDSVRRLGVVGVTSLLVILALLGVLQTGRQYRQTADQAASDSKTVECVRRVKGVPIIAGKEAYRIPATTDLRAAVAPSNAADLSAQHWADLAAQYGITAWINPSGDPASSMPVNATEVLLEVNCP